MQPQLDGGAMIGADDLAESPTWFPFAFSSDAAALNFLKLDEAAYSAASFLDERLLASNPLRTNCPLAVVEASAARLTVRSRYIFHIGHVGSTLISRLVGADANYFALREPLPLRVLADTSALPLDRAKQLGTILALLARTWREEQRTVVKATSIVNELAPDILSGLAKPAAIFVYADPLNYLRGILAGANSRAESRILAPARLRRLRRRLGDSTPITPPDSEGTWIAMNWLCEMTTLHHAATGCESRVLWVDFDAFLARPLSGLRAVFGALGAVPVERAIEALVAGPIMRRYSKAPEHAYDAALRRDVLLAADAEHAAEIKRGMLWLGKMAANHALVQAVLGAPARS